MTDDRLALDVWSRLADPALDALVRAAAAIDRPGVASIARLRAICPDVPVVHAALALALARRKAKYKWPAEIAARIMADPAGVEMASSFDVARHKAARFAAQLGPDAAAVDLCCGIGGDALALTAAGLRVTAVDLDPVRAWMARLNAQCESLAYDILDPGVPDGAFHLDPARRDSSGKRSFAIDALRPPPPAIRQVCAQRARFGGAVKLGPGIDHDDALSLAPGELEFISERGSLTQCVLWTGPFARHERSATRIDGAGTHTLAGPPDAGPPPVAAIDRFVHEIAPSVERARLLNLLCERTGAPMIHAQLGLLTSAGVIAHPMLTAFEVLADMPWNLKRCRAELTRLDMGIVEVKTRGKVVDTDAVQKQLRGDGATPLVAFILRFDHALRCIIARRATPPC